MQKGFEETMSQTHFVLECFLGGMGICLKSLPEGAAELNIPALTHNICSRAFLLGYFDISMSYSTKSIFQHADMIM